MHNKGLLLSGLILSIGVGFLSSSFFFFWSMLELNTLFFVGILWGGVYSWGSLEALKYFLVQGVSSLLILGGVLFLSDLMLMVGSLIKLGMTPFHMWALDVTMCCSWMNWGIFMSLQKFLPLELVSKVGSLSGYVGLLVGSGVLVSCLGSFHKSDLKILMFYSSLFNLSIILTCLEDTLSLVSLLGFYSLVLLSSLGILLGGDFKFFQQGQEGSGGLFLCLLSLGGFPPSVGFFFKWFILWGVLANYSIILSVLIVLGSLWMFYIYLSIFSSVLLVKESFLLSSEVSPQLKLFLSGQVLGSGILWAGL
uniref:NADH-ubiquinone oxidoreductase chain 2 n=1 Tax=Pandarus rhincodonicus TaxID=1473543 RepID=A0A024J521_PANRH|nr:NADH dehydrogenase subunit 2 [Pandarus rhincodonicus]